MPPKAPPSQTSAPLDTAAALERDGASSSEPSTDPAAAAVSSERRPQDRALSDAAYSLLGLPLDKLEEQLQALKADQLKALATLQEQTRSNMALFRGMQQVAETLSAAPAYVQKLHDIRSEMDATRAQVESIKKRALALKVAKQGEQEAWAAARAAELAQQELLRAQPSAQLVAKMSTKPQ